MSRPIQAVILAAGRGTRMKSDLPKVLHPLFGRPILDYPLGILKELGGRRPLVVAGWGGKQVRAHLNGRAEVVVQSPQRGTGHAVQIAARKISRFRGDLLIWPADMVLLSRETIANLIREHRRSKAQVTILSGLMADPTGYGRIVRRAGRVVAIREELDASPAEKRINEVNTGIYLFEPRALFRALKKIKTDNQKKEYYLTDTVRLIDGEGGRVRALPSAAPEEAQGINSRADFARAFKIMNQRNIQKHLREGVTVVLPEQTFIAPDVRIGRDTVIYPWTYIERGVKIGRACRIGPFAKIRSGSVIDDEAVIGSFVEVNRSRIGKGVLAKHLSYLGDAEIGAGSNIGAGTITANYDGRKKHKTRIGKKSFIGVDTVFIAPVVLGEGARTGAGAVLTRGTRVKKGEVVVGVPAHSLKSR